MSKRREIDLIELHMHDPLCVFYAMLDDGARKEWIVERKADVRVECTGTWTRGMTLLDQRGRRWRPFNQRTSTCKAKESEDLSSGDYEGVDDDEGRWRGGTGNQVDIVWASSGIEGGNLKTVDTITSQIWCLQ